VGTGRQWRSVLRGRVVSSKFLHCTPS
jgi:hypothetical protein